MRARSIVVVSSFAFGAAACDEHRRVELYIGPTPDTISTGYSCLSENSGGGPLGVPDLLSGRAYTPSPGQPAVGDVDFNFVIDFISLGGFPGCRGEELLAWCQANDCKPIVGRRWCGPVHIEDMDFRGASPTDLLNFLGFVRGVMNDYTDEVYDQLRMSGVMAGDAPDEPVIVRGVATTQPCDEVMRLDATGTRYLDFNLSEGPTSCDPDAPPPQLVGCAYSCPVLLDEVTTAVTLSLDTAAVRCEPVARVCASNDLRLLPECLND